MLSTSPLQGEVRTRGSHGDHWTIRTRGHMHPLQYSPLTMSNSPCEQHITFPRRDCARVMKLIPHREGWAERRQTHGCCAKHPSGLHMTRQTRRLRGASRPIVRRKMRVNALMTQDARLSALLPWRFLGSGSALPAAALPPQRVQRGSSRRRSYCLAGGCPCLPRLRVRAATAGHHTSLRLWTVSGRRPSMSKAGDL